MVDPYVAKKLYLKGNTLEEVGNSLGVSKQRIYQVLQGTGVTFRSRGSGSWRNMAEARSPAILAQAAKAVQDGMSIDQAVRSFHVNEKAIRRELVRRRFTFMRARPCGDVFRSHDTAHRRSCKICREQHNRRCKAYQKKARRAA